MKKMPWKMIVTTFFFIFGSYVATGGCLAAENTSVPSAEFPEKVFDFGTVLEGKEVTHDFVVRNRGASELLIENVKPG